MGSFILYFGNYTSWADLIFFPNAENCRDDEFDVDLEDIMVMEAIWLSIQVNTFVNMLTCKLSIV